MTLTKGLIGLQDIKFWAGASTRTWPRPNSSGGTDTITQVGNTVDVLAAFGSGTAYTLATLNQAIDAIGSTTAVLSLAPGTWAITDDITFPSNIYLHFPAGAQFSITTAKTATINSPEHVIAPAKVRIFTGAGSVAFTAAGDVNAYWWYDGTDLGPAITDAVAASATSFQYGRVSVPTGSYIISTSVDIADYGTTRYSEINFGKSFISLKTSDEPSFDCTGTGFLLFRGGLMEGHATSTPSSAILFSTTAVVTSDMGSSLEDISIAGKFTKATITAICLAPLTFIGEVKLSNSTPNIVLSLTRTNALTEASVYSTISASQDNISFWAGSRASFTGGTGTATHTTSPVVKFEGACNYIRMSNCYMNTYGASYIELDTTTENMGGEVHLEDIRTEATPGTDPNHSIVVTGANAVARLYHSGGRWVNDTNLVYCPSGSVGGNIRWPKLNDGGGGGDAITLNDVSTLWVGMPSADNLTIGGDITDGVTLYGNEAQQDYINFTGTNTSRYTYINNQQGILRSLVRVEMDGDQSLTANTPETVEFDDDAGAEGPDLLGEFNTTTYTFTASRDGYYLVTGSIAVDATAADYCTITLVNSGQNIVFNYYLGGAGVDSMPFSAVLPLDAAETLYVTFNDATNNSSLKSTTGHTFLHIIRVES